MIVQYMTIFLIRFFEIILFIELLFCEHLLHVLMVCTSFGVRHILSRALKLYFSKSSPSPMSYAVVELWRSYRLDSHI